MVLDKDADYVICHNFDKTINAVEVPKTEAQPIPIPANTQTNVPENLVVEVNVPATQGIVSIK